MVEKMRRRGDNDGADVWLRIIAVITTLGEPPTVGGLSGRQRPREKGTASIGKAQPTIKTLRAVSRLYFQMQCSTAHPASRSD